MDINYIINFIEQRRYTKKQDEKIDEMINYLKNIKQLITDLQPIRYSVLNKQNQIDTMLQVIKERNNDELWLAIDKLIEKYNIRFK